MSAVTSSEAIHYTPVRRRETEENTARRDEAAAAAARSSPESGSVGHGGGGERPGREPQALAQGGWAGSDRAGSPARGSRGHEYWKVMRAIQAAENTEYY